MQVDLTNNIALVTGASRGIGKAIALKLGESGAIVIGTSTSEAGAEQISQAFDSAGIKGHGVMLDVTNKTQIHAVLEKIQKEIGTVSILINNAGITKDNLFIRMKDDEWDKVIETNLSSLFYMSRGCIKSMMKARFGRIVNIGSVVGSMGNAGQTNYAAAKAGLLGFTKSLAREIGSRNITVNAIAPGFIETDMTHALTEAQREALLQQVPLGRLGQSEDIALAVLFLVSDGAKYITGETLHINGGMYMA
jgi:3-oxoacyl-[acyl-carrier protein] reductase